MDKLLRKTNLALVVGTNSWREQFVEAITITSGRFSGESCCPFWSPACPINDILSFCPGVDDDENCGEEKLPSCFDYIMHFLTVFWKLLFALVPPTEYWSGWACFIVSISIIGALTAIIGDIASHFGCTVGLKDSVTAVVFVALGTSVPGVIAGRHLSTIQFIQGPVPESRFLQSLSPNLNSNESPWQQVKSSPPIRWTNLNPGSLVPTHELGLSVGCLILSYYKRMIIHLLLKQLI